MMTLDTRVAIGQVHDVHEVLAFCRGLLGTPPDTPIDTWPDRKSDDGVKWIGNPCGIGLPAWLIVMYGADGPMVHKHDRFCSVELGGEWNTTQEDIDEHAAFVADDPTQNGWAAIVVSFDTAYGYRGDDGESCSDLHARLVTALGQWLDARGLPWKWRNEYTGEWFDRFDQLDSFGNAHRSTGADAWFRDIVMPAIAASTQGGAS